MIVRMMRVLIVLTLISVAVSLRLKPEVDRTGFGPKTVYEWVPGINLTVTENKDMVVHYKNRVCTAIHTSMVLRHGNRWPDAKTVASMENLVRKLNDSDLTSRTSVEFITERWGELLFADEQGDLDYYGEQEMDKIGKRTYQRFHELFKSDGGFIELVSSEMNRTYKSAEFFSNAFVRDHSIILSKNDSLVRFYSHCPAYELEVNQNRNITEEVEKYESSFEVQRVLQKIEDRLNVKGFVNLTFTDARRILEWCAIYTVNEGDNNPWCKVMTSYERKILEYAADLDYYLRYSYGNELMEKISCVITQSWFKTMEEVIANAQTNPRSSTVGSFIFGHSGTLLGTITALGLFKDAIPLSATNVKPKRLFKNSEIAPMSGNVGIVLYSCTGDSDKVEPKYAVQVFVNEQRVRLPQFKNYIVWYDDFKRVFSSTECNNDKTCGAEKGKKSDGQEVGHKNENEALNGGSDVIRVHFLSYIALMILSVVFL